MAKYLTWLKKAFRWVYVRQLAEAVLLGLSLPLIGAAVFIHFIKTSATDADPQFGMAIVSATIGGLLVVAGTNYKDEYWKMRLTRNGLLFLTASVFSALYNIFVNWLNTLGEINGADYLVSAATLLSLVVAVISFSIAISVLIRSLWKLGKDSDTQKDEAEPNI